MNIGGQKLKDKKELRDGAKATVEKRQKEVQKNQKDAAKAEELVKKAEESLDATNKTILVMEQERQEIDQQAADVLEKFQATREMADEKEAKTNEVKAKR